jgi:hypothetical protein
MIFKGYRRSDGALVLVPDCLVASRDAERRHGPLTLLGHFDSDSQPDPAIWNRVLADIDRQSYAVVRQETGRSLVRIDLVATTA